MTRAFGTYQTRNEAPARRDLFSRVWEADDGSGRNVCIVEFESVRLDPEVAARRWRAFEARVRLQQRIADAAGWESQWAAVRGAARHDGGWHAVHERLYPASAKDWARRESLPTDPATLRAISLGCLTALKQARRAVGRGHGNVKSSNILLDASPAWGRPVTLAVLTDPDAEGPPPEEPRDLADLGAALYEIITKRPYPGSGGLVLNTWGAEGRALGRAGPVWAAYCSDLLERRLRTVEDALERLPAPMRQRRRKTWVASTAVLVVALGVGGAIVLARHDTGVPSNYSGPRGNPRVMELVAFEEWLRPVRRALTDPGPGTTATGQNAALAGVWSALREIDAEEERASEIKPDRAQKLKTTRDHYWASLIVRSWKKQANFDRVLDGTGPTNDEWQEHATRVLERAEREIRDPVRALVQDDAQLAVTLADQFPRTAALVRDRLSPVLPPDEENPRPTPTKQQWESWLGERASLDALRELPVAARVETLAAQRQLIADDAAPYLALANESIDTALAGMAGTAGRLPDTAAIADAVRTAEEVAKRIESIAGPGVIAWKPLHDDASVQPLLSPGFTPADLRAWASAVVNYEFLPPQSDPRQAEEWRQRVQTQRARLDEALATGKLPSRFAAKPAEARQSADAVLREIEAGADREWIRRNETAIKTAAGAVEATLDALTAEVARIESATRYEGYVEARRQSTAPAVEGAPQAIADAWEGWVTALCDEWQPRGDADIEQFDAAFEALERDYALLAAEFPTADVSAAFLPAALSRREEIAQGLVAGTKAPPRGAPSESASGEWASVVAALAAAEPRFAAITTALADLSPLVPEDLAAVRTTLADAGLRDSSLPDDTSSTLSNAAAALDASTANELAALTRVIGNNAAHPASIVAAWARLSALAAVPTANGGADSPGAAGETLLHNGRALRERVSSVVAGHLQGRPRDAEAVVNRLDAGTRVAWERVAKDAASRAALVEALAAAPGLGVALSHVTDRRLRANWRMHDLASLHASGTPPAEESLRAEVDATLAELESLAADGDAGARLAHTRLRRIANARSGSADFSSCGPGSADGANFEQPWSAIATEDDASVSYSNPAFPGLSIDFIRVNSDENDAEWSYVATEEVSFELFKAVVEGCGDPGGNLLALLEWLRPSEHSGAVWRYDPETARLALAEAWFPNVSDALRTQGAAPPPHASAPINAVGAGVALYFCRVLGCRPPTPAEWRLALATSSAGAIGPTDPAPVAAILSSVTANLRDARAWREQIDYTERAAAENRSWPDPREAGVNYDVATRDSVWESPRIEDDYLMFAPVNRGAAGSGLFRHLIGNVMELVLAPQAAPESALPTLTSLHDDFTRWQQAGTGLLFLPRAFDAIDGKAEYLLVIGGSALSPPMHDGAPWPLATAIPLAKESSVGKRGTRNRQAGDSYPDLGIRLAFSTVPTPPGPLWERIVAAAAAADKPWYVLP